MIQITLEPIPGTCTATKGTRWKAACLVEGMGYQAASRSGASYALCRELVAAGVKDQAAEVCHPHGRVQLRFPSIHAAAHWTIEEADVPIKRRKFIARPA